MVLALALGSFPRPHRGTRNRTAKPLSDAKRRSTNHVLLELYAWSRIGLGAVAMVAPAPIAEAFGLGVDEGTIVASRMIGGRDLFLGMGLAIAARRSGATRGWIEACMGVDLVDGIATAEGVRRGVIDPQRGLIVGGLVLGALAVGGFLAACPLAKRIPREAC